MLLVQISSPVLLSRFLFLPIFAVFTAFLPQNPTAVTFVDQVCGTDFNNATEYAPNSVFQCNLNRLLSSLSSSSSNSTYYRSSTIASGTSDAVYGAFLCRGDVSSAVCRECISAAAGTVVRMCAPVRWAVIWYDECFLKYSDENFFSQMDDHWWSVRSNDTEVGDAARFMQVLGELADAVVTRVQEETTPPEKFAVGEANFTGHQLLYLLVQCSPDISAPDCDRCLRAVVALLPTSGSRGAQVLMPSCRVRYELYPFYNRTAAAAGLPPPPPQPSSTPIVSNPKEKSKSSSATIVAIVLPIVACLVLVPICWCLLRRRGARKNMML